MIHPDLTEILSRLLDGDLSKEEEDKLYEHVKSCEQCQKQLHELLEMHKMFSEEMEPPVSLKKNVMNSILAENPQQESKVVPLDSKKTSSKGWKRYLPIAAAACFVVIIASVVTATSLGTPSGSTATTTSLDSKEYTSDEMESTMEESNLTVGGVFGDSGTANESLNYEEAIVLSETQSIDIDYISVTTYSYDELSSSFTELPSFDYFNVYCVNESDFRLFSEPFESAESASDADIYTSENGIGFYIVIPQS